MPPPWLGQPRKRWIQHHMQIDNVVGNFYKYLTFVNASIPNYYILRLWKRNPGSLEIKDVLCPFWGEVSRNIQRLSIHLSCCRGICIRRDCYIFKHLNVHTMKKINQWKRKGERTFHTRNGVKTSFHSRSIANVPGRIHKETMFGKKQNSPRLGNPTRHGSTISNSPREVLVSKIFRFDDSTPETSTIDIPI